MASTHHAPHRAQVIPFRIPEPPEPELEGEELIHKRLDLLTQAIETLGKLVQTEHQRIDAVVSLVECLQRRAAPQLNTR